MKKVKLNWQQIESCIQELCRQMHNQGWRPDYVVGITRGGLVPAVMISQYLDVPMHTLKVSLRHGTDDCESNLWMADEAFGVTPLEDLDAVGSRWDPSYRKKILIVDDINDSGATLQWIQKNWRSNCWANQAEAWESVWHHNVRFAVLVNNESSEFKEVDYHAMSVNKHEDPQWIDFHWETWW